MVFRPNRTHLTETPVPGGRFFASGSLFCSKQSRGVVRAMGCNTQVRTQQSRASGAGNLSRYGCFCGTNISAITSRGTWGVPRGSPGSPGESPGGPRGIPRGYPAGPGGSPEGPREVSEARVLFHNRICFLGPSLFLFPSLKMSKKVEHCKR